MNGLRICINNHFFKRKLFNFLKLIQNVKVGFKVALWFKNDNSFVGHLPESLKWVKLIIYYFNVNFDETVFLKSVIHLFPVFVFDNTDYNVLLETVIWKDYHISVHESSRMLPWLLEASFSFLLKYLKSKPEEIFVCVKATYFWIRENVDKEVPLIRIVFVRAKTFSKITSEILFE